MSDYLTVAQAAKESGYSQVTIRRHIEKGALIVERWGPTRRIRIHRRAFERYLRPSRSDTQRPS
jgi:excisionase family DNA binding protein